MVRLVVRRLGFTVFVLWSVTLITFILSRVVPGDPARLIAGPRANPIAVAHIREEYGLDRPIPVQYADYLTRLLRGDLGTSFTTRQPVRADLGTFFPASIELALYALLVGSLLGIVVGTVAALRRGSPLDVAGRLAATGGVSMPAFWLAMLFQLVAYSWLRVLPFGGRLATGVPAPPHVTGLYTVDGLIAGQWFTFRDAVTHLVLPVTTLALAVVGVTARIVRTSVLEVLGEDYVRTARAKGLARWRVLTKHTLRNALLPPVTVLGLQFGLLAGGVFLVETIFAWPGVGRYAYDALRASDYNAIMGVTLVIAVVYVVANLLVDLAYLVVDPRIRYT
jgi:ABC-type dipeptide/oligopeptide/nickel transport system permease component